MAIRLLLPLVPTLPAPKLRPPLRLILKYCSQHIIPIRLQLLLLLYLPLLFVTCTSPSIATFSIIIPIIVNIIRLLLLLPPRALLLCRLLHSLSLSHRCAVAWCAFPVGRLPLPV